MFNATKAQVPARGMVAAGLLLAAALTLGAAQAQAALVWNQPTDFSTTYASQYDPNSFHDFATTYDDFTLGSATDITRVTWVGGYFNTAVQAPINSFELQFWSDAAGQPGSSLMDYVIPGTAGESYLEDNGGASIYSYAADLGSAFQASAGTQYWLSIVANVDFPPQWGWESGTGGDGVAYQSFFGAAGQAPTDMAFTLCGTGSSVTPEPSSGGLLCLGLLGAGLLAARIRRS
jgi:hypothetical protein